jgi:ankyrin repeat protein
MYAAREGRLDLVRMFLERTPETAAIASHKNKLALHFAAGDGHYEVCQLLLQVHPDGASVVTQKGKIALHLAARWGYLDLCQLFYQVSPTGAKSLDWDGSLPLHDACRQGQVYTSQFLLEMYPEGVRVMNLRGEVPIFPAVRAGNLDLVDLLIRAWTLGGRHVLRNVSEDDQVDEWSWETMELLLRGAVDKLDPSEDRLEDSGYSGVAAAVAAASAAASSPPIVGAATRVPEAPGLSPPHVASSSSTDETDSSPSHRNSPVLHGSKKRPYYSSDLAMANHPDGPPGSIEAKMGGMDLDVVPPHGPPAESSQFIPLHASMECGASLPVVLAVLEERPHDLQAADDRGRTALHWAACHAHIRRQDALIAAAAAAQAAAAASSSSSAPPKKKKKNKVGAASAAAVASEAVPDAESPEAKAHLELVERLVTPEAARTRDAHGKLPLHLALESRASLPVVACLLHAHPKSGVLPCVVRGGGDEGAAEEEGEASGSSSTTAAPAAACAKFCFRPFHWACQHDCDLDVIFHLLRADPGVLEAR